MIYDDKKTDQQSTTTNLQNIQKRIALAEADPFSNPHPTFHEIVGAAIQDSLLVPASDTHMSHPEATIISIGATRRGTLSHDVEIIREAFETTGINRFKIFKMPHALVAHDLSYLLMGLDYNTQKNILEQCGDILNSSEATPVWTRESSQVLIHDFKLFIGNILTAAQVRPEIINQIGELMPSQSTLETGMTIFSARTLELLLAQGGYSITIEEGVLPAVNGEYGDNLAAEEKVRAEIMSLMDITTSSWYENFLGNARKLFGESSSQDKALIKWAKLAQKIKGLDEKLEFSSSSFVENMTAGSSPLDAFVQALTIKMDIGKILRQSITEAIRIDRTNGARLPYCSGQQAVGRILDMTANPGTIVALQTFEQRVDTALTLGRLEHVVPLRGESVPFIISSSKENHPHYNLSILSLLKDL